MRTRNVVSKSAFAIVCAALALGSPSSSLAQSDPHAGLGSNDDADDAEPLPEGHPPTQGGPGTQGAQGKHAHADPDIFEAPPDSNQEDATLPAGTIAIQLKNADDKPLVGEKVVLKILHTSVAKGESSTQKDGVTDAAGNVVFAGLESGSGVAYRVVYNKSGAAFFAAPFNLSAAKGMRVVLHGYDVISDLRQAKVIFAAKVFAELRDDRIQFEQEILILNVTKTAWVPKDLVLPLPDGFTALTAQQGMTDQGIDPTPKGPRLRGTYPPGRHEVFFRWQIPWKETAEVRLAIGMPPRNLIQAQVFAAASQSMRIVVEGFPKADTVRNQQGQTVLVTQKQFRPDEAAQSQLKLSILDIPTPGPAKWFTSAIAAIIVLSGVAFAWAARRNRDDVSPGYADNVRKQLLAELEQLERGRAAGDVGPKTYERAYRRIVDDIAKTFAIESA